MENAPEQELANAAAAQREITSCESRSCSKPVTELTTHVLDTTGGRPAAGIPVSLQTQAPAGGDWSEIAAATTDADGRTAALSAAGARRIGWCSICARAAASSPR